MIWEVESIDTADTQHFGEIIGRQLKGGEVIVLAADLGGGKTTLVKGLAKGLGSADTVVSPTFTISRIYKCRNDLNLHHYDFYRLEDPGIVADQIKEAASDKDAVIAVEWADIVAQSLPKNALIISIKSVANNPDVRQIQLMYDESWTPVIRKLQNIMKQVNP